MSLRNHIVWRDGLFIKPHHFQQQQRYFEYLARFQSNTLEYFISGFSALKINHENLLHSKISLDSARGIMDEGTLFDFPGECLPPPVLDVSHETVHSQKVYLALPLRTNGVPEIDDINTPQEAARMVASLQEVRDNSTADLESFDLDVAQLRFRLMLEREDRSSFTSLAFARIIEKRADGSLKLDENFMPPANTIEAIPQIVNWLDDFAGLMQNRARQISVRIGGLGQSGVSDVADFLMLQALNRWVPLFKHLSTIRGVHPKRAYEALTQAAGEFATFTHESRMPPECPAYNHETPQDCFEPVERSLRASLTQILEPNAIMLPLEVHKYGIRTARLNDSSLIKSCVFIVAVKANVPLEKLARDFPAQTKISSIEKIRDLVSLHLPGVTIQALPAAPRQLPYHAGFTYFQLDSSSPGWSTLDQASGFAFHIAGEFPGLEINFWAIRT